MKRSWRRSVTHEGCTLAGSRPAGEIDLDVYDCFSSSTHLHVVEDVDSRPSASGATRTGTASRRMSNRDCFVAVEITCFYNTR